MTVDRRRPEIVVTSRRLREIADDAWTVLDGANDPPLVIKRGRSIVDVVTNDNGQPVIRDLSKLAFKGKLDRVAVFLKMVDGHTTPARPPGDVVADMMGAKIIPLPLLRGIIQAPIYSRQGALSTEEGYQPETEFYFRPEKRLLFPSVPQDPKPANHVRPHSQIKKRRGNGGCGKRWRPIFAPGQAPRRRSGGEPCLQTLS